jgi:hypothetical protein
MNDGGAYEAILRKRKPRTIPKKLLLHRNFEIARGYTARLTVWIPDTPEANLVPAVVLTLSHGTQRVSLSFNDAMALAATFRAMHEFLQDKYVDIYRKHTEALREFYVAHGESPPDFLNDTTVTTVVQGARTHEGFVIDCRTGEVVGIVPRKPRQRRRSSVPAERPTDRAGLQAVHRRGADPGGP